MSAAFHLLDDEGRLFHPADENGGQEGDKGHHHAVAHIVHDIQKLSGGSVWQLSFKIEQAVAQGDHGGSRQVNDRQGNDGLFAFGMEDLYTVGRDGFQHGDAGGQRGENRRHEEQKAHEAAGLSHGMEDLGQGNEHQARPCAHTLDAGEDVYSRNDHSAGQQGDAGIKKLNLADRMVQVYLPLDIRAVGDHDSHGHAEREEQLAHGVQKNLQETAHGQPLHVGREIVAEPRKAGAELAAFVRMLKGHGVDGDNDDQNQKDRHHPFGDGLDSVLDSVVDDKGRHRHENQGVRHRRHRGGDKGGKIVIPGGSLGGSGQVNHGVFGDPAADDRVVSHNQDRDDKGQDTQKLPLRVHFRVSADGAFFRAPPDGDIRGQQGKAEGQHQRKVDDQKQAAAVLRCQIGEAPQISHAHSASRSSHHKAQLPGKMICFLFHNTYYSLNINCKVSIWRTGGRAVRLAPTLRIAYAREHVQYMDGKQAFRI